jgi:hypothetical protein
MTGDDTRRKEPTLGNAVERDVGVVGVKGGAEALAGLPSDRGSGSTVDRAAWLEIRQRGG